MVVDIITVDTTEADIITTMDTDTDLVTTITTGTDTITDSATEHGQDLTDITVIKVNITDIERIDRHSTTTGTIKIQEITNTIKIIINPTIRKRLITGTIPITEAQPTEKTITEAQQIDHLIIDHPPTDLSERNRQEDDKYLVSLSSLKERAYVAIISNIFPTIKPPNVPTM